MNKRQMIRIREAVRWTASAALMCGVLFLSGCSHTYVPRKSSYSTDKIPNYKVCSLVEFKNGQSNEEEILYAENMGHDFFANLHDWTDIAIAITERELAERRSKTAGESGHTLTLRVSSVKVTSGGWGFRGKVTLDAATETGLVKSFKGEAPAANLYNASSGALAAAVTQMLSDPAIIQYLSK